MRITKSRAKLEAMERSQERDRQALLMVGREFDYERFKMAYLRILEGYVSDRPGREAEGDLPGVQETA